MEVKNYSREETLELEKVYCDLDWQNKFKNHKKSQKTVWNELANHLGEEFGINRTGEQCQNKIKNLKKEYYRLKRLPSGSGQEGWPYYSEFNRLYGQTAIVKPVIVVDSLDEDFHVPDIGFVPQILSYLVLVFNVGTMIIRNK